MAYSVTSYGPISQLTPKNPPMPRNIPGHQRWDFSVFEPQFYRILILSFSYNYLFAISLLFNKAQVDGYINHQPFDQL